MKAVFSPGPSFSDPRVREVAGWVHILDLYKEALEELGYEVFIPIVPPELIDQSSTVAKILSYDIVAAQQIPGDAELFLGPPGYSIAQMMAGRDNNWGQGMRTFLYVWNNADWWRDQQLVEEYKKFSQPYDLSPTWRWINKTALEMCHHVIACSPWVKKTHAQMVPEEKISIASWGVDSRLFSPAEKEPEGFKILFVGGDPIRKGLAYLLEALGRADVALRPYELWIVGCAPLKDTPSYWKQFGMVPHEQMPEIYRQCHVLVCPTLEDGIALCVQEAMASGLVPVTSLETAEVLTDSLFNPEGLEAGFKVDYRDVGGIERAIISLKHDLELRRNMQRSARKLAEQQTWERTKKEFKEIILKETSHERA